jgi:Tol biopolymer transport system component/predicted Ser/Thr protein kinase
MRRRLATLTISRHIYILMIQPRAEGRFVKCPQCGTDISDDSRFCSKCGTPLDAEEHAAFSQTRSVLQACDELAPESVLAAKYRIIKLLGRGGMGVVYLAEDTKLRRAVALKFLPKELSGEPRILERFEREAQAASALNHPNICTIYDIDEHDGRHFIAMEFLQGRALKHRLLGRALPTEETIDLAVQIASGLDAAHCKGIVHRDIKPGNIFITDRGLVKILDFGLAKLVEGRLDRTSSAGPTLTAQEPLTSPGAAVGTVAYMSPEQARGEKLDVRTDLFSFGVVLYEMASGRQAFSGPTSAVIFDAILHKAPVSPVRLNPELPPDLERIINKALEKDRRLRYPSAADMQADFERLKRDSSSVRAAAVEAGARAAIDAAPARPGRRRRFIWAAGALTVVALAAAGIILLLARKHPSEAALPRVVNAVKASTAMGSEDCPSWSPDGRTFAYQSDQAGNWDIWVSQVGSSQAANRTEDSPADDFGPSWSPDGQWIAFFSQREGGGYFVMPSVGGRPRKVFSWPAGDPYPAPPQWSPDSAHLVFALGQRAEPWLEILTLASRVSRKLPLPKMPLNNVIVDINWSPDGRWIAYSRSLSNIAATSEIWLTHASDGESLRLTDGTKKEGSPSWSPDSRDLYFVSDRGGTPDLWRLTIGRAGRPEGAPQQVTAGIEMIHVVLSMDGHSLAYTKGVSVRNLFRAPLLADRPITWADTTQLTFDEAAIESVDISYDGRLLVSSDRSGNWDLFLLSPSGGDLQQMTTDPAIDAGPRWKPDGSEIAFYSSRTGHREVWVMPIDGGPARQMSRGEEESLDPDWSPNGKEIVKVGVSLCMLPAQGGQERRLTDVAHDLHPDFSPDGRWVVFDSSRDGTRHLWRISASGGQPERLTKGAGQYPRWSPDGKHIYFVGYGDRKNNVWALSIDNREERPITALAGRRGVLGRLGLATDGKNIYFTWEESRGDIWVADLVQSQGK